jgi:hypothetical protein
MIKNLFLGMLIFTSACLGAQGSGIYFECHVSRGIQLGDKLYAVGSSSGFLPDTTPYQYNVRYAFSVGYEYSFNKVLSLRGGAGYQNVLMNAYAATIQTENGQIKEIPFIQSKIDRHWLNVPIDFKVMLPFRKSGVYLAAGPKFSFLLSSTVKDSLKNREYDLKSDTPGFNFGIGAKLGFEFAIGTLGHLLVESGYCHGLLNTSPVSGINTKEGEASLLGLGFRVNLSQKQ